MQIMVSAIKEPHSESGIITTTVRPIRDMQVVLKVGENVRCVKEGDIVVLDYSRFAVKKHKDNSLNDEVIQANTILNYEIPIFKTEDGEVMLVYDTDIVFVVDKIDD